VAVLEADSTSHQQLQSGPEKIAQNLTYHHFAAVCSRIMRFLATCLGKVVVYQSVQNSYQVVKYSLINSQNWINVMSDVTLHVNMTPLTIEDRLLIKTMRAEKG